MGKRNKKKLYLMKERVIDMLRNTIKGALKRVKDIADRKIEMALLYKDLFENMAKDAATKKFAGTILFGISISIIGIGTGGLLTAIQWLKEG